MTEIVLVDEEWTELSREIIPESDLVGRGREWLEVHASPEIVHPNQPIPIARFAYAPNPGGGPALCFYVESYTTAMTRSFGNPAWANVQVTYTLHNLDEIRATLQRLGEELL